jgi:hypothetical protein
MKEKFWKILVTGERLAMVPRGERPTAKTLAGMGSSVSDAVRMLLVRVAEKAAMRAAGWAKGKRAVRPTLS